VKKNAYVERVHRLIEDNKRILFVHCDNVGSAQMANIRRAIRGRAEMLMGKNTLIRKAMDLFMEKNPGHPIQPIIDTIRGNIGLIFTNIDLTVIRDVIEENRVPAPARSGAIAPNDVVVPAGSTGLGPDSTAFFQSLDIATKISRGQVEIISPVHLLRTGDKVNPGQAALLAKLDIRPFTYGLQLLRVYDDGSVFDAAVLDLTEDDLARIFLFATRNIAAVSMQTGIPTLASVPHSLVAAAKKLVAIVTSDDVDYEFEFADPFLKYLADPSAFAAAAGAGAAAGGAAAAAEEEEEEEEDVGGAAAGLFGDDDGGDGY